MGICSLGPCGVWSYNLLLAQYEQRRARGIVRKAKCTDSWFISRFGMNLYRGCEHACAYCDGRAEKYRVEGEFGREIQVKVNAAELLRREVPRLGERGFLFLGGGVSDAYQPAEADHALARAALEVALENDRPVHLLTKGLIARRDLDLLRQINQQTGAILSVSLSCLDPELAAVVEPGCPPPLDRLALVAEAHRLGMGTGVMLMPVLPYLSDGDDQLEASARAISDAGADFTLVGGLTLKPGRQREHFYGVLQGLDPDLVPRYRAMYGDNPHGAPRGNGQPALERRFMSMAAKVGLNTRMPHRLYRGLVSSTVEAGIVLIHLGELSRLVGAPARDYMASGRALLGLKESVVDLHRVGMLGSVSGLGPHGRRVVEVLLETGRCVGLERLMAGEIPGEIRRGL